MKYVGKMVTKLLLSQGFIDSDDKAEVQQEFDNSISDFKDSKHPIVVFIWRILSSPLGIFMMLYAYVKLSRLIRRESMLDETESAQALFERELEERVQLNMLDKIRKV